MTLLAQSQERGADERWAGEDERRAMGRGVDEGFASRGASLVAERGEGRARRGSRCRREPRFELGERAGVALHEAGSKDGTAIRRAPGEPDEGAPDRARRRRSTRSRARRAKAAGRSGRRRTPGTDAARMRRPPRRDRARPRSQPRRGAPSELGKGSGAGASLAAGRWGGRARPASFGRWSGCTKEQSRREHDAGPARRRRCRCMAATSESPPRTK